MRWGTLPGESQPEQLDWRAFRAQLVQAEQQQKSNDQTFLTVQHGSSDNKGWIFEQAVIEQGSVLVHHPSNEFCHQEEAKGLEQQFLHKAIVLVIEHTPTYTIGLVLNRPTDLILRDKCLEARIHYGGDNFSIHTALEDKEQTPPKFYCLHSLHDNKAVRAQSTNVMSGLYFTSISAVHELVHDGHAHSEQFAVLCGYVGWSTAALEYELEQGQWRSTTLDADALHRILQEDSPWEAILASIDCFKDAVDVEPNKHQGRETFNDRMLKEWSRQKLVFGEMTPPFLRGTSETSELSETDHSLFAGDFLCAADSATYLLDSQENHQSILLLLQDDDDLSVACLLNHPTNDDAYGEVPIRFGGFFHDDYDMPPFILHRLPDVGGEPVGHPSNRIWKASARMAQNAIDCDMAVLNDFLIIKGMQVWPKDELGLNFLHREYARGRLRRLVSMQQVDQLWNTLREQTPVKPDTLDANLKLAQRAWSEANGHKEPDDKVELKSLGNDAMRVWAAKKFLAKNNSQP